MKATLVTSLAMQMLFGLGCVAGIDGNDGDDSATGDHEPTIDTVAHYGDHDDDDDDHDRRHVLPNGVPFRNESGYAATVSTAGRIDLTNEFFQDLGTNGRRCVSCHLPTAGWGITPQQVQEVFAATHGGEYEDALGLGAIFRTNDGANSPNADVSTYQKRKTAYSMLLNKGLIRVGIGIPSGAEFDLDTADDPYHFASAAELSL